MGKKELCYKVNVIPDLTLNRYSALEENGVEGVLRRHTAFLRQWNRKGILSGVSIHLYYFYDGKNKEGKYAVGAQGDKLNILFVVRGDEERMENIGQLMSASSLSEYFHFTPCSFEGVMEECNMKEVSFSVSSTLIKKEVFLKSSLEMLNDDGEYYIVPKWEINENARLYTMFKLMEALDRQLLYRIDLYPVEKGFTLREDLRKPMAILRERQTFRLGKSNQRDFEAENVLKCYEELLNNIDSSPHFIANIFMFGNSLEDSTVTLDAAGAEALVQGNYEIGTFTGKFSSHSFLNPNYNEYYDTQSKIVMQGGLKGMTICKKEADNYKLRYLPTLFTLEEAAAFFKFPVLYEGEVIQKRKETAPNPKVNKNGLFLGTDDNKYEVYFPLENLSKHAFIAGVPGSGKTNTMHHLTSMLWKKHNIAFLVLEPAKQEYRALTKQKGMEELCVFAPNADMSFPLHINPFEFPKGLMVAEHIRNLCSVFEGAFPLYNPMPFLLDQAIEAVYRENGWTPETVYSSNTTLKFPTMSMLYKKLEEELESTTYSGDIRGNLESALKVRIGSLLRREMGNVFDVPSSTISPEKWLQIPAIIELEAMGTGPANFLTLMLCTLIREVLKVNPYYNKGPVRHVIFIEEAHNLIGPEAEATYGEDTNPKQAATAFIVKMLAEVRALKEGIVIADQLPTVMAPEVIKNTGLKMGLRITAADDRELLGNSMAASRQQLEEMATFNVGRTLISYEGLVKPFTMQTHQWCGGWSTPHCKEFDINWCKTNCMHYFSGDCEPVESERRKNTTSPSDEELVEIMKKRTVYREICDRSFIIESDKLQNEYRILQLQIEKNIEYFTGVYSLELEIEEKRRIIFEIQKTNSDKEILGNLLDDVKAKEEELENKNKNYGKYERTYDLIVDCIKFAKKICNQKKHWKKLGIEYLQYTLPSGKKSTEIQQKAKGINDMQEYVLYRAQHLFGLTGFLFSKESQIEQLLRRAVEDFGGKWIL